MMSPALWDGSGLWPLGLEAKPSFPEHREPQEQAVNSRLCPQAGTSHPCPALPSPGSRSRGTRHRDTPAACSRASIQHTLGAFKVVYDQYANCPWH